MPMKRSLWFVVALLLAVVAITASGPASGGSTQGGPAPGLELFAERLQEYLALRDAFERKLEPLRPLASAAELAERQNALASAVTRARGARVTDPLVPPGVAMYMRQVAQKFFASDRDPGAPIDLLPSGHPPVVHGRYPSYVSLSTIPPQLIAHFPVLLTSSNTDFTATT